MKRWLVCKGDLRQIWEGTDQEARRWRDLGYSVEEV